MALVICPCKAAGNPRDHGDACHYKGQVNDECSGDGRASTMVHDRRCCVAVCAHHARWRTRTSRMLGHSMTCPKNVLS